ncbi:hypothetical protein [Comamonas thiooxydans]|uniref:hypothetical protein n=1 Tax=Comamonas thiooxydans TaxID=363952 RepID=UPI001EE67E55|nr:hypothetical protein [Comamonas thiooxydans]
MQDKITIADAPDCLNTNDKAMWVLGYEAAIEARGQCLHQIQEPAAADVLTSGAAALSEYLKTCEQHAIVPDVGGAFASAFRAGFNLAASQAAPAAVAVPDERAAFELEMIDNHHYVPADFRDAGLQSDGSYADDDLNDAWFIWQAAWQARAALAATPASAAPVVLPEPDAYNHGAMIVWSRKKGVPQIDGDLYTARTVRALLATATGLPAQAVVPSDAELIALNAGECFFSESPSKYPELGHGTQYHGGAPGVIGFARAALALRADPAAYSQKFQQRVQPWMMTCFGPEISADRRERNHRFLEEALELVQSCGCTASEAHQLVDYVYGRPWGEPAQEAGGVMVTLAALCLANGLDMQACGETELARIWTKVEAIRAKQAAKPKHSPLPEHAPQAQADARDAALAASEQDALRLVRQAVRDFHYALDNGKHGGVAAGAAMNAIELALNMYWQQGQEADRRANQATQGGE